MIGRERSSYPGCHGCLTVDDGELLCMLCGRPFGSAIPDFVPRGTCARDGCLKTTMPGDLLCPAYKGTAKRAGMVTV